MTEALMLRLVQTAGVAQLLVVLASLGVPMVLGWRAELKRLSPLTRSIFWTYAGYIAVTNLAFSLLSACAAAWLLDGSGLAACVCGFIGVWWTARLAIQFSSFHGHAPQGPFYRLADIGFTCLFAALSATYGLAVWWNLR